MDPEAASQGRRRGPCSLRYVERTCRRAAMLLVCLALTLSVWAGSFIFTCAKPISPGFAKRVVLVGVDGIAPTLDHSPTLQRLMAQVRCRAVHQFGERVMQYAIHSFAAPCGTGRGDPQRPCKPALGDCPELGIGADWRGAE